MNRLQCVSACLILLFFVTVSSLNINRSQAGSVKNDSSKTESIAAIQFQQIATGLQNPIYITNAGDDRLFFIEQAGRIRIYQSGALLPTPFLDITSLVRCCGEQGLLGLAFHPNYPTVPYFYVNYTIRAQASPPIGDGATVISRFTVSGNANIADASSEQRMLVIPQPFTNHNGGMMEFGPDGLLYIASGDGGSANDPGNRAQNINELLGKILRIDVDQNVNTPPFYGIPAGNPFAGATAGADEIYLLGLRNPWRFSFERGTNNLWIGDVGQGAWEEIDRLDVSLPANAGGNLGWRVYEGTPCTGLDPCVPLTNYVAPIAQYNHSGGRCSITGGYAYRGSLGTFPTGAYIYGDYCSGEIFSLQGATQSLLMDSTNLISSFGEDNNGEIYTTGYTGGQIFRIVAIPTGAATGISGRVTTAEGIGVYGAALILSSTNSGEQRYALTNPFGYYQFADVPAGSDYIITVKRKGFSFEPPSRFISLNGELTDVNFTAIR